MTFIYNFVHIVGKLEVWVIFLRSRLSTRWPSSPVCPYVITGCCRVAKRSRLLFGPPFNLTDTLEYFRIFDKIMCMKTLIYIILSFSANSLMMVLRLVLPGDFARSRADIFTRGSQNHGALGCCPICLAFPTTPLAVLQYKLLHFLYRCVHVRRVTDSILVVNVLAARRKFSTPLSNVFLHPYTFHHLL